MVICTECRKEEGLLEENDTPYKPGVKMKQILVCWVCGYKTTWKEHLRKVKDATLM